MSNRGRSQNFQNLTFLHILVAHFWEAYFLKGIGLKSFQYANSLLYNVRSADLMRLQRLQNKAARLVFACERDERSVDLLTSLHWLPVKERILFKFILFVFKCMNHAAPSYLVDLVSLQSDKYTARRQRLGSSTDTTRLFVPRSRKCAGGCEALEWAPGVSEGIWVGACLPACP